MSAVYRLKALLYPFGSPFQFVFYFELRGFGFVYCGYRNNFNELYRVPDGVEPGLRKNYPEKKIKINPNNIREDRERGNGFCQEKKKYTFVSV